MDVRGTFAACRRLRVPPEISYEAFAAPNSVTNQKWQDGSMPPDRAVLLRDYSEASFRSRIDIPFDPITRPK